MANYATTGKNRVPRILFFINGVHPTDEEREDAAKYAPNYGIRNAQQVASLAMSPLEECDAVAGPAIPQRYLDVYPSVNGFDPSQRMLRMSDLDRDISKGIHSVDNEAARAAKAPGVGGDVAMSQGAQRGAGSFTAALGGFVAPRPGDPDNVLMSGSERAENAMEGAAGAGTQSATVNPHRLPEAGVTQVPEGDTGAATASGATTTATPAAGFTAPEPVEAEGEDEPETGKRGRKAKGGDTGGSTGDTGAAS